MTEWWKGIQREFYRLVYAVDISGTVSVHLVGLKCICSIYDGVISEGDDLFGSFLVSMM